MKKIAMRAICLILCLALYLGGTAFAEDARVAMGRYVETKLDLYGDWRAFAQTNGVIYAVDGSGDQLLKSISLSSNNWDSLETGHDENTSPALGGVNGITVAPDGTLYLSSGWAMMNEEGYPYVERIKDGHAERVDLDQRLGGDTDQLALCALPSGELLGLSDIEVYRFSPEGTTLQKYAVPGGASMAVHGNEVAVCSTSNSLISVLDIETGETLRMIPLPGEADYGVVGYDANGALYYVCPDGLYQANAGSTMLVQIADGKLMTAGKSNIEARALLFDPENNPIIAYSQGGSLSLIAYHYDENVPTEPNNLLSVYALYDSQTLREYINLFQQAYPDIIIDVTVGLPKGTAITRDDAIRTLNTELLTGNGPDVMILDGLPIGSYIQQGVLLDLAPVVQPMLDSGELQANVAGAFKTGDAIPAVPTRFLLPTIWGDVTGLNTLADLTAWAQANPDVLPVYALDPELLIGTFYLSCAPAWFNDAGQLDEGRIAEFLTDLKAIRGSWTYEAGVQKGGEDYKAAAAGNGIQVTDWNPYDRSVPRIEEAMGGIMMMKGLQKQLPRLLRGKSSTSEVNGQLIASSISGGGFALLPGQAEGCFVPMLTLGVSRSSVNTEIALAFVSYALGTKAQDVIVDDSCGFPVNTTVLDAMLIASSGSEEEMSAGGGADGIEWTDTWLGQTQCDQLRAMVNGLQTPVLVDYTLYQMIVNESVAFFDGRMDASQTAQNICAKANAYLTE